MDKIKMWFLTSQLYNEIFSRTSELTGVRTDQVFYHYLYIIHKIISHTTQNFKHSDYVGCPINNKITAELFGKRVDKVSAILNNLQKWGMIVKTKNYCAGEHSNHFKINTDIFSLDKILFEPIANDLNISFINKLLYDSKYKFMFDDEFTKKCFNIMNESLRVNTEGTKYISDKYGSSFLQSLLIISSVENKDNIQPEEIEASEMNYKGFIIDMCDFGLIQILTKQFYCKRPDPKSRVYSNLTNLPSIHRQYLSFNGSQGLIMTDISNSQILLSLIQIKAIYKQIKSKAFKGVFPEDMKAFQVSAESGLFYEDMAKACGETFNSDEDRQAFKKRVFEKIWFSKNSTRLSKEKKAFKALYPTVFDMITRIKKDDYTQFAKGLQVKESQVIVSVAKQMLKAGKAVLTLHDAIICNANDLAEAESLIEDALTPYGITPKFKRDIEAPEVEEQEELLQEAIAIINNPYEPVLIEPDEDNTRAVFNINDTIVHILLYSDFEPLLNALNDSDRESIFQQIIEPCEVLNELVVNNIKLPVQRVQTDKGIVIVLN